MPSKREFLAQKAAKKRKIKEFLESTFRARVYDLVNVDVLVFEETYSECLDIIKLVPHLTVEDILGEAIGSFLDGDKDTQTFKCGDPDSLDARTFQIRISSFGLESIHEISNLFYKDITPHSVALLFATAVHWYKRFIIESGSEEDIEYIEILRGSFACESADCLLCKYTND